MASRIEEGMRPRKVSVSLRRLPASFAKGLVAQHLGSLQDANMRQEITSYCCGRDRVQSG